MTMEELLGQLRDIHLPTSVSWWPPAWGWWALPALLSVLFALFFLRRLWRARHSDAPWELALLEIKALVRRHDGGEDATLIIAELSVLLRRVALSYFPRTQVASMTGEAWLRWLDDCVGEPLFSGTQGDALVSAPYRRQATLDVHRLFDSSRRWLVLIGERHRRSV